MMEDPNRPVDLSDEERALVVERKAACPFIGSAVAEGQLRVRNSASDPLASIEEEFDLVEDRESVGPLLTALPDRERQILLLRFFGGLTQTEIGAQVGLSQMHVSRLIRQAVAKLRTAAEDGP